jgi:hypothetical protein
MQLTAPARRQSAVLLRAPRRSRSGRKRSNGNCIGANWLMSRRRVIANKAPKSSSLTTPVLYSQSIHRTFAAGARARTTRRLLAGSVARCSDSAGRRAAQAKRTVARRCLVCGLSSSATDSESLLRRAERLLWLAESDGGAGSAWRQRAAALQAGIRFTLRWRPCVRLA